MAGRFRTRHRTAPRSPTTAVPATASGSAFSSATATTSTAPTTPPPVASTGSCSYITSSTWSRTDGSRTGKTPRPAGRSSQRTARRNERVPVRVGIVMQTWEAITARRNVRSFAGRPIAQADLDQILEAGRRSPSSQNWQPWDFIVVTDRAQLAELAAIWYGTAHVAGAAAAIAVVGPAADNRFHRAQF